MDDLSGGLTRGIGEALTAHSLDPEGNRVDSESPEGKADQREVVLSQSWRDWKYTKK